MPRDISVRVGGSKGEAFRVECPVGTYVNRWSGSQGAFVEGITLACSNDQVLPRVGGTGSTPWSFSFATGFINLRVRSASDLVAALSPTTSSNGALAWTTSSTAAINTTACPANSRVVGIYGTTVGGRGVCWFDLRGNM